MSGPEPRLVVDASVGAKLFLPEPLSEQAQALFDRLSDDPPVELYVPDLFYVECGNILWKHTRFFDYPEAEARQDIEALGALALHSVPTSELLTAAFDLATAWSITAYDACYAALARRLDVPLVTVDSTLEGKLADSPVAVRSLGTGSRPAERGGAAARRPVR